jgi:hypothetical protein
MRPPESPELFTALREISYSFKGDRFLRLPFARCGLVGGWNSRVFLSHTEAPRLLRNAGLHLFLVPKLIAKPGVQAMISSQSRVQYREGYDPSDNYADEGHFSPRSYGAAI